MKETKKCLRLNKLDNASTKRKLVVSNSIGLRKNHCRRGPNFFFGSIKAKIDADGNDSRFLVR